MKKLNSIFTDNLDKCLITGVETNIERHHVFEGLQGHKKLSEKYGFIVPLHRSLHPNGAYNRDKNWVDLDHWLKRMCQEWYTEVAQIGTKGDWYEEFGKYYDDRCNENVYLNGKWMWDKRRDK